MVNGLEYNLESVYNYLLINYIVRQCCLQAPIHINLASVISQSGLIGVLQATVFREINNERRKEVVLLIRGITARFGDARSHIGEYTGTVWHHESETQ